MLINKQESEFSQPALVELLVEFAFVPAVSGVFLENISITSTEFFQDAGFVDYTRTAVIGKGGEEVFVFAVLLV